MRSDWLWRIIDTTTCHLEVQGLNALLNLLFLSGFGFRSLKTLRRITFHTFLSLHAATHFIFPKTLFVVRNLREIKPPAWSPPVPGLSCSWMSIPVLPQKTLQLLCHWDTKISLSFSALCCPHLTETILLKTFEKKNGCVQEYNGLRTLKCFSFKGVKQERSIHWWKKAEKKILQSKIATKRCWTNSF